MGVAAESASASGEQFMRVALQMAERSLAAGGPPVGACLVRDGAVIASAQNSVVAELDATAHAEVSVIRAACKALRTLELRGCHLYVTVEPCAMCLAACCYAGIDTITFGAPIESMQVVTGREFSLKPEQLVAHAADTPRVTGGLLVAECSALVEQWATPR